MTERYKGPFRNGDGVFSLVNRVRADKDQPPLTAAEIECYFPTSSEGDLDSDTEQVFWVELPGGAYQPSDKTTVTFVREEDLPPALARVRAALRTVQAANETARNAMKAGSSDGKGQKPNDQDNMVPRHQQHPWNRQLMSLKKLFIMCPEFQIQNSVG